MKVIHTPCVHLCELDYNTYICKGCYRTLEEIEEWPSYSEEKQLRLIEMCRLRSSEGRALD